ncbi:MAG: hypothetical protein AAF755_10210 [Pseudomonadota bacterium]
MTTAYPSTHEIMFSDPVEKLQRLRDAVQRYAALRSEVTSLATFMAVADATEEDDAIVQRHREVSDEYLIAGETIKKIAMTLSADGILERCIGIMSAEISR